MAGIARSLTGFLGEYIGALGGYQKESRDEEYLLKRVASIVVKNVLKALENLD